jgi:hypothetical protein
MKTLLLGAGSRPYKQLFRPGHEAWEGTLVRLDYNADHKPDIVADLEVLPYSWAQDEEYDELHAYEVLEHTGQQGDWKFFFAQFSEFWRILKPKGRLFATVPRWDRVWAWGDPSHKRVINHGSLTFLSQDSYKHVGQSAMSDFRFCYKADFAFVWDDMDEDLFKFVLEKR